MVVFVNYFNGHVTSGIVLFENFFRPNSLKLEGMANIYKHKLYCFRPLRVIFIKYVYTLYCKVLQEAYTQSSSVKNSWIIHEDLCSQVSYTSLRFLLNNSFAFYKEQSQLYLILSSFLWPLGATEKTDANL